MIIDNKETTQKIIDFLKQDKPFTYLRYGDGDFIAMYPESTGQVIGANNQSFISPDIQNQLIKGYSVNKDNYLVGTLQDIRHPRSMAPNVDFNKISKLPIEHPNILYSAIALQEAFMEEPEQFLEFCKLLSKKRTLYINHYFEYILSKFYGDIKYHIQVPQFNACQDYKSIINLINNIDSTEFDQIILSCGQLSRVIGKDLYELYPDKTIIDVGSVSDKLIYGTESFKNIKVRGHIRNNQQLIQDRLKYFIANL